MNIDYQNQFSERFRKLISDKGLSQKEIAKELNVTKSTISLYVTGKTLPNIFTAKKICEFFDVSANYLLGIEDGLSKTETTINFCDLTGLSKKSISALKKLKESGQSELLNDFLEYLWRYKAWQS